MRIVHIAPNVEAVPPKKDGGTERIIHELTEELVRRGHDIILFAPRGSTSSGHVMHYPFSENNDEWVRRFVLQNLPEQIDLIHDHTFSCAFGRDKKFPVPIVNTLHLAYTLDVKHPIYVSRNARDRIGGGKGWYVHNGLRPEEFQFSAEKADYLLFMGRLVTEKGVLHALDIAERIGAKLVIAGPVHYRDFFEKEIEPRLMKNPNLIYVGAVGGQHKQDLLKKARCVLFPSVWEEPFGLVMIEAMACGTPVLALNRGAVSDVMRGFPYMICGSPEEMVEKLRQPELPVQPELLRQYVIDHFTVEKMGDGYLNVYHRVLGQDEKPMTLVHSSEDRNGMGHQAPEHVPDMTPDDTPDPTPHHTLDRTPDETPNDTPDETLDHTPYDPPFYSHYYHV